MADVGSLLFVLELLEDFEFTNDIMDDNDDVVVFSTVSCFMCPNLTRRISGYMEQTVPSYLSYLFQLDRTDQFSFEPKSAEILVE